MESRNTEHFELSQTDLDQDTSLGWKRPPMLQMQPLRGGAGTQQRTQKSKQAPLTAPPQLLRPLLIDRTANAAATFKRQISDGRMNMVNIE